MVEYRHPVRGVRTQGWGANPNNGINGPGGHLGIDVACAVGVPIRACGDGIIEFSGWATDIPGGVSNPWAVIPSAAGGFVMINHGKGEPNSSYGHMLETYFNKGDFVKGGTIIGKADTTGLASGSHLHYAFMPDGYVLQAPYWGQANPDNWCKGYWDDAPVSGGGIVDTKVDNLFVTGKDGARRREAPDKNAPLIDEFLPNREIVIGGYVRAKEPPYPGATNIWLVGGLSGGYMWLGSFVNQNISAIPDLTPAITPPVKPAPTPVSPPKVVAPPYDFTLDFAEINGIKVEKKPANNTNVDTGNMPATVADIVKHWWNDPAVKPTMESVINTFTKEGAFVSAHWIIGEYRIVQMVAMKDRAYHAGPAGNGFYGFEIDPRVTEKNADGTYTDAAKRIQANVKALHRAVELKKGHTLKAHLHNEFMNTQCSKIDLASVEPNRQAAPPVVVPGAELTGFLNELDTLVSKYRP